MKVSRKKITKKSVFPAPKLAPELILKINRPSYTNIEFPNDISRVASNELGELLGKYSGLQAYAMSELSFIKQKLIELDARLAKHKGSFSMRNSGNYKEKWKLEQSFELSPTVVPLKEEKAKLKMMLEGVDARVNIFAVYVNALSREMTRRHHEQSFSR